MFTLPNDWALHRPVWTWDNYTVQPQANRCVLDTRRRARAQGNRCESCGFGMVPYNESPKDEQRGGQWIWNGFLYNESPEEEQRVCFVSLQCEL